MDQLFNKLTVFDFYLPLALLFIVEGVIIEQLAFHVPNTATVIATLL